MRWALGAVAVLGAGLLAWWASRRGDDAAALVGAGVAVATEAGEVVANAGEFVRATATGGAAIYWKGGTSRDDLHPQLVALLDWWAESGPHPVKVVSTGRTDAQQAEEYAKGRTAPGPRVTNAQTARDSAHGWRLFNGRRVACAIDLYPYSGNPLAPLVLDTSDPRWSAQVEAVEAFGLQSGAHFSAPVDFPHVQVAGFQSLPYVG